MRQVPGTTLIEQAHEAAARGNWQRSRELFAEADASAALDAADLALLGRVAYAAGDLDATIEAWERAHAESLRAGNRLSAAEAAVRVAMHLLFDTALLAPVRAWLARAERLLSGEDDTPVHAWLAVVRNYERMLSGDFTSARRWARRAIEIGAHHDPAAAAIGRVAEARSLILEGDVTTGLALLDDAAVATVTGEIDPLTTGVVYCEVVCAMQALAQYDLAEQWTAAMERWHHGQPVGSLHGRCRVHRAELLRLRGCCAEAEEQALLACEELRPYLRRELGWPLTELGRIRLRRGDVNGAEEAFLAAHDAGWDPQPGLALVHLARGELSRAAASVREALTSPAYVPSKEWPPNTELRRAPLLEAQVEIEVAAGDIARSREAAEELGRIANRFSSRALAAAAALSRGRVHLAAGDADGARRDLELAARSWSEIGAPYEAASARMLLAEALRFAGHDELAALELRAADAAFERMGAVPSPSYVARSSGGVAPITQPQSSRSKPTGDYVFRREGDFWLVVFEGRTARVRDSKGLRYVARLLASPRREFHALELVAMERGAGSGDLVRDHEMETAAAGDAGELLDARAKAAYRRRLAEIDEDVAEANRLGDERRATQAEHERELLVRELARAVGLGGRVRRAGSASERARSAVTRAVRHAVKRIGEHDGACGAHLERAVRTGTHCAYVPDAREPFDWSS